MNKMKKTCSNCGGREAIGGRMMGDKSEDTTVVCEDTQELCVMHNASGFCFIEHHGAFLYGF